MSSRKIEIELFEPGDLIGDEGRIIVFWPDMVGTVEAAGVRTTEEFRWMKTPTREDIFGKAH